MINLFEPIISKNSIKLVNSCLQNNEINSGKFVEQLEKEVSALILNPYAVAVNSCTSALHLALLLSNVNANDEVILPSQTFVATGVAILMIGAIPVFADINKDDGTINIEDVKSKITNKTKAIITVDWAGYPSDIKMLKELCGNKIKLIEDAAQALGSKYLNEYVGSINTESDFICFSFQAIKTITSGDGGMLICKKHSDYLKAKKLRWFGIDKSVPTVNTEYNGRFTNLDVLGYKYNMNDISASLALGNLKNIHKILKHTTHVVDSYKANIRNKKIKFLNYNESRKSNYWFFPVLVETQKDFIYYMKQNKINISVVDKGIDVNPIFNNKLKLPNQRFFELEHVGLPTHYNLTEENLSYIINTINEY